MKTFLRIWLSISLIAIGFGIGLVVIATAVGGSLKNTPTFSLNESYEGVKKLDMDISYGSVKLVVGDEFSISAENFPEDTLESYVTDGIWVIEDNNNNYMNLFGWKLPIGDLIRWDDRYPKIIVTIPDDFVADDISLHIDAGTVEAESINTITGDFSVDAGKMVIQQLAVSGKSSYHVGAGDMVLKNIEAEDITVECSVGNIEIDGVIAGNNDITCDVGNVSLNLDADKDEYSYEVNSDIGNVMIDGKKYNGIGNEIINNKETDNALNLKCDIGSISVEFN
jgi:hypothetical protein